MFIKSIEITVLFFLFGIFLLITFFAIAISIAIFYMDKKNNKYRIEKYEVVKKDENK